MSFESRAEVGPARGTITLRTRSQRRIPPRNRRLLMAKNATLTYDNKGYELPVVIGTEAETAVDISALRAKSGLITLDNGYANTGACTSKITFIDGEKGILRYRGYPVEELAE